VSASPSGIRLYTVRTVTDAPQDRTDFFDLIKSLEEPAVPRRDISYIDVVSIDVVSTLPRGARHCVFGRADSCVVGRALTAVALWLGVWSSVWCGPAAPRTHTPYRVTSPTAESAVTTHTVWHHAPRSTDLPVTSQYMHSDENSTELN
jgi:hypothetical protein